MFFFLAMQENPKPLKMLNCLREHSQSAHGFVSYHLFEISRFFFFAVTAAAVALFFMLAIFFPSRFILIVIRAHERRRKRKRV